MISGSQWARERGGGLVNSLKFWGIHGSKVVIIVGGVDVR